MKTTEIIICDMCKGEGVTYEEKLTCYHRGEYDYIPHQCSKCKGSGLMEKTTITEIKYVPYKPRIIVEDKESQ